MVVYLNDGVIALQLATGVYNHWTGGLEICGEYICSYSQFVLRINYMLLYSTTKYDEGHPVGQAR